MDSDFRILLETACREGNVQAVEELLDKGGDSDEYVFSKELLLTAIRSKNETIVKLLLERGSSVNNPDGDCSSSPLHIAAASSDVKTCECLLDRGAKIDHENFKGETPFHHAVDNNNVPVVEMFIKKGIDVNHEDFDGLTPLHTGVLYDQIELIETLLDAGSDVYKESNRAETSFLMAIDKNNVPVVEIFIKKGIDVNHQDSCGRIPLHYAAENSELELVRILLDAGSDVEQEDEKGQTPFFTAAYKLFSFHEVDNEAVLKLLLDRGAEINKKDNGGYTPLLRAIQTGTYVTIPFLLNAGAVIDFPAINCNSFYYDRREALDNKCDNDLIRTKAILKKNFYKLLAGNVGIDASMVKSMFELDDVECERFEKSCELEVEKMKMKKFGGVSLYDVLMKTDNPTFADNINLEQFIHFSNMDREFPNHDKLLKSKFRSAKKRNNLLKLASFNVKVIVLGTFIYLPNEIQRKILCYLSNEELEILKVAFQDVGQNV